MTEEIGIIKRGFYILNILFLISYGRSGFYYSEIKEILGLKDGKINRALKLLRKDFLIVPRTIPAKKGQILVKYELTKRGELFLRICSSYDKKLVFKNKGISFKGK